jgi:hypothetical protein
MSNIPSDSTSDTMAHIHRVRQLIDDCAQKLYDRGRDHDESKLVEPEKSAFDRLKALSLSGMDYGSEEYRACLRAEKPAIDHHYAANSHHPEFYPRKDSGILGAMIRATADAQGQQADAASGTEGSAAVNALAVNALLDTAKFLRSTADHLESSVNGMSLFDVLEMLMDWKAATERMKNGGDIRCSLEINTARFALSPQLASILANTIREMKW